MAEAPTSDRRAPRTGEPVAPGTAACGPGPARAEDGAVDAALPTGAPPTGEVWGGAAWTGGPATWDQSTQEPATWEQTTQEPSTRELSGGGAGDGAASGPIPEAAGLEAAGLEAAGPLAGGLGVRRWGGRYRDVRLLALGGMGEVRTAVDEVLGRKVAVKLIAARLGRDPVSRARFRREAALLASLRHEGVVTVLDYGVAEDGRPYLVMPLLRGRTLARLLGPPARRSPAPARSALRQRVSWLHAVAVAVAHAHAQGLVHRDLKPSNIMVTEGGRVVVLDWGLARPVAPPGGPVAAPPEPPGPVGAAADDRVSLHTDARCLTRAGAVQGTVAYMAPEQAAGGVPLDARVDVWALGAILFELLSGVPPFGLGSAHTVLARVRSDARLPLPPAGAVPDRLRGLVARCLAREPAARPADASAVARELEQWLHEQRQVRVARRLVAEAAAQESVAVTLQAEAAALAARLGPPPSGAPLPLAAQQERWALDDALHTLEERSAMAGARAEDLLHAAIEAAPELAEARRALCDRLQRRHAAAEAAGRPGAARRLALRLARYDDGTHAAYLGGASTLSLHLSRPARVVLHQWQLRDHLRVPDDGRPLGRAPVIRAPCRAGSQLLRLTTDDGLVVALPVVVPRAGALVLGTPDAPLWLPARDGVRPGFDFVPAGPARLGGDPRAQGLMLPAAVAEVAGFCMARWPVRVRDYLAFVEHVAQTAGTDPARRLLPRPRTDDLSEDRAAFVLRAGRVVPQPDRDGDVWDLDWPVVLLRHQDCVAYCDWLAAQTGLPMRLPTDAEWEKAARGADGAVYPWGTARIHPSFCLIRGSARGPISLAPMVPEAYPVDTSVYGTRWLAGGVRERVARTPELVAAGESIVRGGDYGGGPERARGASRLVFKLGSRGGATGFRVAYTPPR